MNHSPHPCGADGKDRNVNKSAGSCGSTERGGMDCAARRGFAGKQSRQISDKTQHPESAGEGIWRGSCTRARSRGGGDLAEAKALVLRKQEAMGSH